MTYFSEEEANQVVDVVGLPLTSGMTVDNFAEHLEEVAVFFIYERKSRKAPPPSKLEKKLNAVESASHRLFKTLLPENKEEQQDLHHALRRSAVKYAENKGELPGLEPRTWTMQGEDYIDYRPNELLARIIQDMELLNHLARDEAKRMKEFIQRKHYIGGKPDHTQRHRSDEALIYLFDDLLSVYESYFGKEAGASVDPVTGKVGGPCIRFVSSFLTRVSSVEDDKGLILSDSQIRDRLRAQKR